MHQLMMMLAMKKTLDRCVIGPPAALLVVWELLDAEALPVRVAVRMKFSQDDTVAAGTVEVPDVVADP